METLLEDAVTGGIKKQCYELRESLVELIKILSDYVHNGKTLTLKDGTVVKVSIPANSIRQCITVDDIRTILQGESSGYDGENSNSSQVLAGFEKMSQRIYNEIIADITDPSRYGSATAKSYIGKTGSIYNYLNNKIEAYKKQVGDISTYHSPNMSIGSTLGANSALNNYKNVATFVLTSSFNEVKAKLDKMFNMIGQYRARKHINPPELSDIQKNNITLEYLINGSLAFSAKNGPVPGLVKVGEDGTTKGTNSGSEFFVITDGTSAIDRRRGVSGGVYINGSLSGLKKFIAEYNSSGLGTLNEDMITKSRRNVGYIALDEDAADKLFNQISSSDVENSIVIPFIDNSAKKYASGNVRLDKNVAGGSSDGEANVGDRIDSHIDRTGGSEDVSNIRLDRAYQQICRVFKFDEENKRGGAYTAWLKRHLIEPVEQSSIPNAQKEKYLANIKRYLKTDFGAMDNGEALLSRITAVIVQNMCDEINSNAGSTIVESSIENKNGFAYADYNVLATKTDESMFSRGLLSVYKEYVMEKRANPDEQYFEVGKKQQTRKLSDHYVGSPDYNKDNIKASESTFLRDCIEYNAAIIQYCDTLNSMPTIDDVAESTDSNRTKQLLNPHFNVTALLKGHGPINGTVNEGGSIDLYRAYFIKTVPELCETFKERQGFIRLVFGQNATLEKPEDFVKILSSIEAEDVSAAFTAMQSINDHMKNIIDAFHQHAEHFTDDNDKLTAIELAENYATLAEFENAYLPIIRKFDPSVKGTEEVRDASVKNTFVQLVANAIYKNDEFPVYYYSITDKDFSVTSEADRREIGELYRPFRNVAGMTIDFADSDAGITYAEVPAPKRGKKKVETAEQPEA